MWSFGWIDFERGLDRQQDLSSTWDSLCEEFRLADQLKLSKKKRAKRKSRSTGKSNERGVMSMIQLSRSVLRSITRRMVVPVPTARSRRWYVRLKLDSPVMNVRCHAFVVRVFELIQFIHQVRSLDTRSADDVIFYPSLCSEHEDVCPPDLYDYHCCSDSILLHSNCRHGYRSSTGKKEKRGERANNYCIIQMVDVRLNCAISIESTNWKFVPIELSEANRWTRSFSFF